MHELSVTEGILEVSLRHAKKAGVQRITGINLVIGQFSSIVDDSVQFYWDIVSEGTIAHGARLHFERVAGKMTCRACQHVFTPTDETFECPACHSPQVQISAGNEFFVDSIDVE